MDRSRKPRFRNPRYAPELLEQRLSPSSIFGNLPETPAHYDLTSAAHDVTASADYDMTAAANSDPTPLPSGPDEPPDPSPPIPMPDEPR